MKPRKYKKCPPAMGSHARPNSGHRRVAVTFDDATFAWINTMVVKYQVSFAHVVRSLCKVAIKSTDARGDK